MSLGRRLKAISDGLSARDPQASATLHGFIEDLRASDIMSRVKKVGDEAPAFSLRAADGSDVSLDSLVARGPVILSFYRGRW